MTFPPKSSPAQNAESYKQAVTALTPVLKDRAITGRFSRLKQNKGLQWQAEKMFAMQLMAKNDKVCNAVRDNPLSLAIAMIDMAILGVSLSPTLGHAYLIPETVNGTPTVMAMISYKGLENLALKSGSVLSIQTELVYTKDKFRMGSDRDGAFVQFEMARGERGELEGGFCRAQLSNGQVHVEWMEVKEIEGCHKAAIAKQGKEPFTWVGAFKNEMRKKCVVRRAAKHWVLPERMVGVLAAMDAADPMSFSNAPVKQISSNVILISDKHIDEITTVLVDAGVDAKDVPRWLDMKAKAWGHTGISAYPDSGWEKLRDGLLDRQKEISRIKEKAQAGLPKQAQS